MPTKTRTAVKQTTARATERPATEREGQSQDKHPQSTGAHRDEGRSGTPKATRDPLGPEVTGWPGKTIHSAQVEPAVPTHISGQDQDGTSEVCTSHSIAKDQDNQKAEGQEAASAQAVKRGHQVTMIEVPDDEDDTSFQKWVAKGSPMTSPKQHVNTLPTPPESPTIPTRSLPKKEVSSTYIKMNKVTSPMVAMPSAAGAKVLEAPHQWMRPFEVDWMLCAICKA